MNRFKTTLRLLIACFLAGAVLCSLNRHGIQDSTSRLRHSTRLFHAPLRSVTSVSIACRGKRPLDMRLGEDGGWTFTKPIHARANGASIARLLDALEMAPVEDFIDETEMRNRDVSYVDFGLSPPSVSIALGDARGKALELSFGAVASTSNRLFAAVASQPGVFVTSPDILPLLDKDIGEYVARSIVAGDPHLIDSVAFRRPGLGYLKLVRNGAEWRITQPSEYRADWAEMSRVFDTLYRTRPLRVELDVDRANCGFESSDAVQIHLFGRDDPTGTVLAIGGAVPGGADEYYARLPDSDAVFVVPGAVRRIALLTVRDLRDHRLFPSRGKLSPLSLSLSSGGDRLALARSEDGWEMTAPVSEKADPAGMASLLNTLFALSATGFSPPAPTNAPVGLIDIVLPDGLRRLSIHAPAPASSPPASGRTGAVLGKTDAEDAALMAPAAPQSPLSASVNARADASPLTVVLSSEGRPDDTFLVPPSQFSAAAAALSDPRPLLDRTVLALSAASIQRITVAHVGGTTNVVARDANGLFAAPLGQVLAEGGLESLLSAAAGLQADRVEAIAPADLLPYGLDLPAFEVAFDLADETGLRRTLSIGARTPDSQGRYVSVKGHDIVFVIPRESADAFMRPLYSPEMHEIGSAPLPSSAPPSIP